MLTRTLLWNNYVMLWISDSLLEKASVQNYFRGPALVTRSTNRTTRVAIVQTVYIQSSFGGGTMERAHPF
jgi:hypothetical protein